MEKVIRHFTSFLGILATLATFALMIAIVADVIFRFVQDRSIPGLLELSETTLVAAVFLGMAYAGATNSHIAVDLLTQRLRPSVSRWVISLAWIATTVILSWFTYATLMRAIASTESREARTGLLSWPLYPARWLIVIGFASMLIVAIANVIRTVSGREVLSIEEQMPDAPEHDYEFVGQKNATVNTKVIETLREEARIPKGDRS